MSLYGLFWLRLSIHHSTKKCNFFPIHPEYSSLDERQITCVHLLFNKILQIEIDT